MRKKMASSFVVAFVLLVGIVPASAQVGLLGGGYRPSSLESWYYYLVGDQVHMLQADNIEYVRRTMNIGQNAQFRRVTDDLGYHGGYYGLNTSRGFYPMAQCSKGQRIGRYAVDVGVGTLLGAVFGGKKGAAIGGGLGAAVAVREDLKCWGVNNQEIRVVGGPDDGGVVVDGSPPPTIGGPQTTSGRPRNGWDDRLREQRYGNQPRTPTPVELEWQMLRNEFAGVTIYVRVQGLDPNQPIVIPPSQTKTAQVPQGAQIWAEALICLDETCAVQRWRQDVGRRPLPQGAGWVFYNPEEGR